MFYIEFENRRKTNKLNSKSNWNKKKREIKHKIRKLREEETCKKFSFRKKLKRRRKPTLRISTIQTNISKKIKRYEYLYSFL